MKHHAGLRLTVFVLGTMSLAAEVVNGQQWHLDILEPNTRGSYLLMEEEEVLLFKYNFTVHGFDSLRIFVTSTETKVLDIRKLNTFKVLGNASISPNVSMKAVFLGRASLTFHVDQFLNGSVVSSQTQMKGGNWYDLPVVVDVTVKKKEGVLNRVFTVSLIILVCLANIAMGCQTDIQIIKDTLRTPIAPATGLASQFVLMPLISFAVGYLLQLNPPMALGLFAMGCSPGGAASNVYTYFLDGNVSLSVTMTIISTIASMALVPLWLFTLGIHVIYRTNKLTIPFINIITSLVGLVIPVGIGIIIQKKRPKWAKILLKLLRPITALFVILVFTVGIYANLYIFRLMTPLNLLAGALLPYIGFLFGGIMALITRRNKSDILTIAIETGIQNSGVAIVLLQLSLPHPDSDIAIVSPVNSSLFTPAPLAIAIIFHIIRKRYSRKKDKINREKVENGQECVGQTTPCTIRREEGAGDEGEGMLSKQEPV